MIIFFEIVIIEPLRGSPDSVLILFP